MIVLIIWLFFYASDHSIYQNLAVVLVLIVVGSISAKLMGEEPDWEWKMDECPRGMGWRVAVSVVSALGWLAFLIAWLAFYAGDYTGYENLAIALISILALGAVMGLAWIPWAMRQMP